MVGSNKKTHHFRVFKLSMLKLLTIAYALQIKLNFNFKIVFTI